MQVFYELWMHVQREIEEAYLIFNNDLGFQYEDEIKQMNDKYDMKRCITYLEKKHTRKHQYGQKNLLKNNNIQGCQRNEGQNRGHGAKFERIF